MINTAKIKEWKFVPFENFTIISSMGKEKVISSLNSNVDRNVNFTQQVNRNSYKDYEGFITEKEFRIRRIIKKGYNSFIPIVIGRFYTNKNEISISIRPHKFVLIFLGLSIIFALSLFVFTSNFYEKDNEYPKELVEKLGRVQFEKLSGDHFQKRQDIDWSALLIPLPVYLLMIGFFNYEKLLVKEDLLNFLDAKIKS